MGIIALMRKDWRDLWRERALVIAILVQALVAGFASLLWVGLVAFEDVGALAQDTREEIAFDGSAELRAHFAGLDLQPLDVDTALERYQDGEFGAVVWEHTVNGNLTIDLWVPEGELTGPLTLSTLARRLSDYEHELRASNQSELTTQIVRIERPSVSGAYEFEVGTLVPLLVLTPVILAGALAGDSLGQERRTGTLVQLRASPLGPWKILLGKLAAPLLLVPLQILAWWALLGLHGVTFAVLPVLVLAVLLAACLCSIGMALGASFTQESVQQASYSIVVLALLGLATRLPRDPINLIVLLGQNSLDAAGWQSLAILAVVVAGTMGGSVALLRRALSKA